jgi:acetyl esterase
MVVAGDSAGGNLAAGVAQRARDHNGPVIDHQLLIYPVVTPDFETPSYLRFAEGHFLTRASMQAFWRMYTGPGTAPRYADLYRSGDLAGLPAATVITCGLDVLSDEGDEYARRLDAAGVPVTHIRVAGLIHGIWYMDATGARAYQFGLDVAGALRRAVGRGPSI